MKRKKKENINPMVVWITGAGSGIGKEMAKQLMQQGACVYATSRSISSANREEFGTGKIIPVRMDVNSVDDLQRVMQYIMNEQGRIDAVVCNAGNGIAGSVEDTSDEEARYQMETNFFGTIKTIQTCLPVFRKQRQGKIMVTSSVAALVPIPYQAFYSAGKAAALLLLQALSMEVKPFGIQCCAVLPGDTRTGFTDARKMTVQSLSPHSPYGAQTKTSVERMEQDELNGMNVSVVARAMVQQLLSRRMKPVIVPGIKYKAVCALLRIVPQQLKLWIVARVYHISTKKYS